MRKLIAWLKALNREAALDSVKNVLAVLGVGTVIGDFASKMPFYFMLPAAAILVGVWYLDYLRHDFHPHETALKNAQSAYEEIHASS